MRLTHYGSLGHSRMPHQGGLQLHRAETMPADVHHVVDAPKYPEVPFGVPPCSVPGEIRTRYSPPVILLIALGIAPESPQHAGPGFADDEEAFAIRRYGIAAQIDDVG